MKTQIQTSFTPLKKFGFVSNPACGGGVGEIHTEKYVFVNMVMNVVDFINAVKKI